jgi:hypothetical protein
MARHKQPDELARLKGAHKNHPERYRGEIPKSTLPIGDPPGRMSPEAQKAWHELAAYVVPGVLTGADRPIFEVLANLFAEYWEKPAKFPSSRLPHLVGIAARFGLTPSDRIKLAIEPQDDDDDFVTLN